MDPSWKIPTESTEIEYELDDLGGIKPFDLTVTEEVLTDLPDYDNMDDPCED